MSGERPTISSAEPSKLSAIANLHSSQPLQQPQLTDQRPSTNNGPFGFKLPEYVKIIIYFAIIFIPICCLMLWFINKGRKVSMMLDKTIQENETLQQQVAQLKTQNISLQRNLSSPNNDSCCFRKPNQPTFRNTGGGNNYKQPKQPQYQHQEPIVEPPLEPEIDITNGNINLIIDADGNLYTSTGIFFSGPGLDGMGGGMGGKHSDVRIEEIPDDDDENGTPIEDFEEEPQNNETEKVKEVEQSEPLLDSEQEETQNTKAPQSQPPQKAIPKMAPKGAPSKK